MSFFSTSSLQYLTAQVKFKKCSRYLEHFAAAADPPELPQANHQRGTIGWLYYNSVSKTLPLYFMYDTEMKQVIRQ